MHLYTDVSTQPHASVPVSTWAVVLADPCSVDNVIVESGMLPGRQDNFCAELYAVFVAVIQRSSATLYPDNISVVLGFRVLLARGGGFTRAFCKMLRHPCCGIFGKSLLQNGPAGEYNTLNRIANPGLVKNVLLSVGRSATTMLLMRQQKSMYRELPHQVADVLQKARQAYAE